MENSYEWYEPVIGLILIILAFVGAWYLLDKLLKWLVPDKYNFEYRYRMPDPVTKSVGLGLIAHERLEQIERFGYTDKSDAYYNFNDQLTDGAIMMLIQGKSIIHTPSGWDTDLCEKMCNKPKKERIIIAAALLAAELDRLDYLEKINAN
jgi:hypothetical protein